MEWHGFPPYLSVHVCARHTGSQWVPQEVPED